MSQQGSQFNQSPHNCTALHVRLRDYRRVLSTSTSLGLNICSLLHYGWTWTVDGIDQRRCLKLESRRTPAKVSLGSGNTGSHHESGRTACSCRQFESHRALASPPAVRLGSQNTGTTRRVTVTTRRTATQVGERDRRPPHRSAAQFHAACRTYFLPHSIFRCYSSIHFKMHL